MLKKILLIPACLTGLLFTGCQKDDAIEGPELNDLFGEFLIIESPVSDRDTVDFSAGETVNVKGKTSIRTPWVLRIKGLTSGAVKELTGNEKDLELVWNGSITYAPFFRSGENVQVMIRWTEQQDSVIIDTIHIKGARPVPPVNLLIDDFETYKYYETFSEGQQSANNTVTLYQGVSAAVGQKYYVLAGNHIPGQNLFICGAGINASTSQSSPNKYFSFGTQNPDHIYFNAFIYGYGDGNTSLGIQFQEDDDLNGTYKASEEGSYGYSINIDWVGWKLVSFPLSATTLSTAGGFGNIDGTGRKDMDRIISMQYILLATTDRQGPVRAGVDFAAFTYNFPFQP